jgi:hypothetical protein
MKEKIITKNAKLKENYTYVSKKQHKNYMAAIYDTIYFSIILLI